MTAWVLANGQILLFFAQLAYWFFMVLLLGYAVFQYKRWVNFQLGFGRCGRLRGVEAADEPISIEEFVE